MTRAALLVAAARTLADADSDAPDVSELVPGITLQEAQRLQSMIKAHRLARGDRIAGYVAAFTSAGSQRLMPAMPVPLVGAFLRSQLVSCGSDIDIGAAPCLLEAEIAVRLRHDLAGPAVTEAEAREAIGAWFPALEIARVIPGSLDGRCSVAQMIALQKSPGGAVVLGAERPDDPGFDPAAEAVSLYLDDTRLGDATGAAAMDGPVSVVAAMARRLAETGQSLRAGQILLTGSLAPPHLLPRGTHRIRLDYATLGTVTLSVTG